MPWEERTAMGQRKQFIEEFQLEQDGFAELCRKYEVSRQTGYKWVARFEAQGEAGLEDLSRAPRKHRAAGVHSAFLPLPLMINNREGFEL